jgi:hypothetical protein
LDYYVKDHLRGCRFIGANSFPVISYSRDIGGAVEGGKVLLVPI